MLSKKDLISAVLGLSITALPVCALGAGRLEQSSKFPRTTAWAIPQHSPVTLADEDDHEEQEEHHHHHRWHRDEGRYHHDDDDYYWGSRNRYDYAPSYFAAPAPNGWDASRRQAYLMHRRDTAIMLRNRMRARGDVDAAHRLDDVIGRLNRQLR